jgi:hypothetical protein
MTNETVAWLLIGMGVAIAVLGAAVLLLARLGFSGLPGTLSFHGDGVSIYIPIVASVVASVLLTIVLNVLIRLR